MCSRCELAAFRPICMSFALLSIFSLPCIPVLLYSFSPSLPRHMWRCLAQYLYLMCQTACIPLVSGLRFLKLSASIRRFSVSLFAWLAIMRGKIKIAFLALCCKFLTANFGQKCAKTERVIFKGIV